MKRWLLKAGAIDLNGLILEDAPVPQPGPGQVRVRVRAVALNARDLMVISAPFYRMPGRNLIPVSDGAGEIDAVGAGVTQWSVGDRVTGLFFRNWLSGPPNADIGLGLGSLDEDGMLAEFVVLRADRVARVPQSLDDAEAATLPCAGLTAWSALDGARPVGAGDQVLVLGTGGVALMALVLAKGRGAKVTVASSKNDKLERARALGADGGVNYADTSEWGQMVFERTGGVNRVINPVGTSAVNQSLAALVYGGEVVSMGVFTQNDGFPLQTLMMKTATLRGTMVGGAEMHHALVREVDANHVKPPISQHFPFDDAKAAFEAQGSSELFGKIVIDVA